MIHVWIECGALPSFSEHRVLVSSTLQLASCTGSLLSSSFPCRQVRAARHADMSALAAAHAADTSSEWNFEDLMRGEASPAAAAAAKLLAAAAAGQYPRRPSNGLQVPPMPVRTLP